MAGQTNLKLLADFFNKIGHSRPMRQVPVPINVRSYSNSDIIVRLIEVTLKGQFATRSAAANCCLFDHIVGKRQ
jgi:hypothetical protein